MKITEDYVSFEVAKLLKEKEFNEETEHELWYVTKQFSTGCHWNSCTYKIGDITREYDEKYCIAMPTHQMACKWLREVHNIFIEIYLPSHSEHEDTIYHGTYSFDIFNLNTKVYVYCTWNEKEFNSYEEAIEAAIKYTLENLI